MEAPGKFRTKLKRPVEERNLSLGSLGDETRSTDRSIDNDSDKARVRIFLESKSG